MFNEEFRKNPNITQLAPKLFIYRNFISGDLLEKINEVCSSHNNDQSITHNIDWYHERTSGLIPELIDVWEKASELIYPDLVMHPQCSLLISREGEEGMFAHSDAPGQPHEDCGPICGTCDIASAQLIAEDKWGTCCRLHYGLVIYFGNWEGGEIYYTNINKDGEYIGGDLPLKEGNELTIKPENGDLVIHGSHFDYNHGTRPVTKGTRFAFSNFVLPAHTNPGTFYNYKSEKYNEQIKEVKSNKDFKKWMTPVNGYVWQDPPAVIDDKEKGINGVRYRDSI